MAVDEFMDILLSRMVRRAPTAQSLTENRTCACSRVMTCLWRLPYDPADGLLREVPGSA
jgi:hypothetical protein